MSGQTKLRAVPCTIQKAKEEISDEELFELHRRISRLATRARMRDPEYQQRQRMGVNASRAARAR